MAENPPFPPDNANLVNDKFIIGRGSILGAILTLPANKGVLLTTFLAVFVTWVGLEIWSLLSYGLHEWRSTPESHNALHYQQQVLLRSGLPDWKFLWRIIVTTGQWRSSLRGLSPVRRSAPLAIVALLHAILIAVASIFSSKIASTTGQVLVRSSTCGAPIIAPFNPYTQEQEDLLTEGALNLIYQWITERSLSYSNACYRDVSSSAYSCKKFVRQHLDFTVNSTAYCPFPNNICITPAFSVDTGYVDSDYHLGINAVASNRINFRKKLTCALVNADNYTDGWTTEGPPQMLPSDPDLIPGAAYKFYNFGNQIIPGLIRNWTFVDANYSGSSEKAYGILSKAAFIGGDAFSDFDPIPEFNRTDADVSLWILQNRAYYTEQVHDPFFRATTPYTVGNFQLYKPDSTVNVLACTEQYSFCNGLLCTDFDALMPITIDVVQRLLGYNAAQLATFAIVKGMAWATRISFLIFAIQEQFLLANSQVFGSYRISTQLPTNQWQMEIMNLFNISLATIQVIAVTLVSPPDIQLDSNMTYDKVITSPNTTEGKNLCNSQKILSSGEYSFSLFGLVFILGGGLLIIVLSNAVPPLVEKWQAKSSDERAQYRRREWNANDVLCLQRIALESNGIRPWRSNANVPTLMKGAVRFKLPWLLENAENVNRTYSENDSRVELLPLNPP